MSNPKNSPIVKVSKIFPHSLFQERFQKRLEKRTREVKVPQRTHIFGWFSEFAKSLQLNLSRSELEELYDEQHPFFVKMAGEKRHTWIRTIRKQFKTVLDISSSDDLKDVTLSQDEFQKILVRVFKTDITDSDHPFTLDTVGASSFQSSTSKILAIMQGKKVRCRKERASFINPRKDEKETLTAAQLEKHLSPSLEEFLEQGESGDA